MGSIWSGRWAIAKRATLVEQCYRIRTPRCPKCHRSVRWVYSLPSDGEHFACRLCLGLKYRSQYAKALKNHQRRLASVDKRIERIQAHLEAEEVARRTPARIESPTM